VIFVLENNQYAYSTPLDQQFAVDPVERAAAYGFPGVTADGNDPEAMFEVTRLARERALAGAGPTLIEAVHYRAAPHATADDPRAYIDLARVEEERGRECVGRYDGWLRRLGVLDDATAAAVKAEAEEAVRDGIRAAEAEPAPDPSLLFDHAYAIPPEHLYRG
jgi:pyruvate dehydrogenase E1 component alpha subunit